MNTFVIVAFLSAALFFNLSEGLKCKTCDGKCEKPTEVTCEDDQTYCQHMIYHAGDHMHHSKACVNEENAMLCKKWNGRHGKTEEGCEVCTTDNCN